MEQDLVERRTRVEESLHGREDLGVPRTVEVLRDDELEDVRRRVTVDEQSAQKALLRFEAMRKFSVGQEK